MIDLNNVINTYDVTSINNNFDSVATELNEKVFYRDPPEGASNEMKSNLDMNSNRILNLPAPLSDNEPVRKIDMIPNGFMQSLKATATQLLSGNGTQTVFTLTNPPDTEENTQVYVSGIYQQKNTYTLSGSGITFSEAPLAGTNNIEVVSLGAIALELALPTKMATSSGATLIGVANGTTGVLRTVSDKLNDIVSLLDFITDVNDVAAGLQKAIDHLPSSGGTIRVPAGVYLMNSGVTFSKNLKIVGDGKQTSTLRCVGANGGVAFFKQTGGDFLHFESVAVTGNGTTTGPIATVGSIAYSSYNNSSSNNADFIFWDTVSVWAGGYYHKHVNSNFEYCKTLFSGYDQNNLAFFGCRWSNFQTGVDVVTGEGPITFLGGSIEYVADKAFTSQIGRQVSLTLVGAYIENGANVSCPSGITSSTGKFDNGVIIYSTGPEIYPIVIIGCTVFTSGIFRVVYSGNSFGSGGISLIAHGNRYIARNLGPTDAIYVLSGASISCDLHDEIIGALPGSAVYIAGLPASMQGCRVFDPITRDFIKPVQVWTTPTLQNAWTDASGIVGYTVDSTNRVTLRGTVNGGSATASTMFTLPSNIKPTNGKFFICSYNSGFISVRVLATGAVYLDATVGASMNGINLDPISFYVGS